MSKKIEEKKSPNVWVTILGIVLIIAMFFVGWFAGGKTAELEEKIIDKATEEKDKKKEEKNVEKEKEVEIKELDLTKCLNNTEIQYSNPNQSQENTWFSAEINDDKKSVTVTVNWDELIDNSFQKTSTGMKTYQAKGFDKKIKKVYIDGFGQDYTSGQVLFYLMEDGTVEYTPLYISKQDINSPRILFYVNLTSVTDINGNVVEEYFESDGVIPEVTDVVDFYSVGASGERFGWHTTIAATSDGAFYDLFEIINQ